MVTIKTSHQKLNALYEKFQQDATRVEQKHCPVEEPLNSYIDHTLLKPDSSLKQIKILCEEAMEYKFKTVCIQPYFIRSAAQFLTGSTVLPITVIGFPLGANTSKTKMQETQNAIQDGAKEIDMVINISALKSAQYDAVFEDICAVSDACQKTPLKVIVETAYLTRDEKIYLCACVQEAKVTFIKTSTGFAPKGAALEDVVLFKHLLKNNVKIKASGGIKTADQARAFIGAGALRLGTSSGVEIIKNLSSSKDY